MPASHFSDCLVAPFAAGGEPILAVACTCVAIPHFFSCFTSSAQGGRFAKNLCCCFCLLAVLCRLQSWFLPGTNSTDILWQHPAMPAAAQDERYNGANGQALA
jgi:hypothetical protein